MMDSESLPNRPVILFDGSCTLCQAGVRFIQGHSAPDRFSFISLYSEQGRKVLSQYDLPDPLPDSLILICRDKVWWYSDAVLNASRYLKGIWSLGVLLKVFPLSWRDRFYRWIAKNRHRWVGTTPTCHIHEYRK